jgi:threonylcarbamoyladenosine tRNA methylthiotransferase MtaB
MKICILTLGCKVNQYESAEIAHSLRACGCTVTERLERADLYIINTCAVTGYAEKKSRYEMSRILRRDPGARIVVCGCAAELNAAQFKSPNVIKVFGTDKTKVAEFIMAILNFPCSPNFSFAAIDSTKVRNRAFIKVQDGCNNFCSYCIVPHLRGRSRSRSIADVTAEINALDPCVREVVLTGIDLSSFGPDAGTDLAALCLAVDGCGRAFRLSSLEVRIVTPEFLNSLKACRNFCPSFHLSLQSGSAAVLHAMNRHYTPAEYMDRVSLIRAAFQDAQITTDIICGFPTETDADARATVEFVKKVRFLHAHIFPYSCRTATAAAKLPQLQPSVITDRARTLTRVQSEITREILRTYVGRTLEVLIESEKSGIYTGTGREYITVKIPKPRGGTVPLDFVKVLITDANGAFLLGAYSPT